MLIVAGAHNQQEQNHLQQRCKSGELTRLRRGIYAPTHAFQALALWERYDLHCIAVAVARPSNFLVGKAAAAMWDIPYGAVPRWVEIGSVSGCSGDRDRLLKVRRSGVLATQSLHHLIEPFSAGHVTSLPQTLLDLARWHPLDDALQAIDHCLNRRLVSRDQLRSLLPALRGRHGAAAAARAIDFAHHGAESPRESLVRLKLWEAGLPAPHVQAEIWDRYGNFIGRADFFYDWAPFVLEYDGDGKYQGRFGVSPGRAAKDEMRRTKALNNAGVPLIRITRSTWNDGSWLDDVKEALEWGRRHGSPFPAKQWRSAGLAWTRGKYGSQKRGA